MGVCNKIINPDYWVEGYDEYIASISYGKDSLTMLETLWVYGYPLTQIVTVDVMATDTISAYHEDVERFKEYADQVIFERYGIRVTHLKAARTYDESFHRVRQSPRTKPENMGKIYGFPITRGSWCNRDLKMVAIDKHKAENPNSFWYVGYAIDEKKPDRQKKIKNCPDLRMYPLCNHNLRERECIKICSDLGLLSPTYTTAERDGCWFCHLQSLEQLRLLRKNHPDKWQMLLNWDLESPVTFKPDATVHDLELRFQLEEMYIQQGKSITSRQFYNDYKNRKKVLQSEC